MQHIGQLQATLLNFGRTTGAQAKQFIPIERIKRLLFNASVIALVVVLVMAFLNSRLSTSLVDLVLVGAIPHTTYSFSTRWLRGSWQCTSSFHQSHSRPTMPSTLVVHQP